mgnify:FL=1
MLGAFTVPRGATAERNSFRVIFDIGGSKYPLVVHMSYRRMTLPMIRKIHEEYGVPPEVLIQDYPLKRTGS